MPNAVEISGPVAVSNFPASQPVTGIFWQASQPVSGTFWQSTQPVSLASVPTHAVTQSGAWSVSVIGTVPVSGAFWQATQPVSIASMPSTPVTGTFWQATQPVSGAFFQATQPVSGTFWQATQPVSVASMPSTPVTGAFWQATQPVSIAAQVKAREDIAAMTWASLKSAAPAANAVQATTGALAAGDYDFNINLSASDTVAVGKGLVIEHRNAADAATLQVLGSIPAGASGQFALRRYTLATNERIRVIAGTAAGAASSMYVSAIGRRLT